MSTLHKQWTVSSSCKTVFLPCCSRKGRYLEKMNVFLSGERSNTGLVNAEGLGLEARERQGLGSFCDRVMCWWNDREGKRLEMWNIHNNQEEVNFLQWICSTPNPQWLRSMFLVQPTVEGHKKCHALTGFQDCFLTATRFHIFLKMFSANWTMVL